MRHDSPCQRSTENAYRNLLFIKHVLLNVDCVYDTMRSVGIIHGISRRSKCMELHPLLGVKWVWNIMIGHSGGGQTNGNAGETNTHM